MLIFFGSLVWGVLIELMVSSAVWPTLSNPDQASAILFSRPLIQFCSYNRLATEAVGIHQQSCSSIVGHFVFGVLLLAASSWVAMLPPSTSAQNGLFYWLLKQDVLSVSADLIREGEAERPKGRLPRQSLLPWSLSSSKCFRG